MIKMRWPLLATLGLLLGGAAPTPGPGVPTPTGTLQGVFPFYWDGSVFQPMGAQSAPSSAAAAGIAPVVSAALEASHVLKATPGNLYSVYVTNLTGGTAGNLQIFNATSAPTDGAVTPIVCVPFNGLGLAEANYLPGPPAVFSTGITAVISSATSCFTKTTGVLTGFVSGMVQ
jgi:hypothetical protein